MKNKSTIIMFYIVIVVVGIAIYLSIQLSNRKMESVNNNENKISANLISNTVIPTGSVNNEIYENLIENEINEHEIETKDIQENKSNVSNAQKAIDLVKKDWGADNSVYFHLDEIKNDGTYVVSVRDKNTTEAIIWYDVDIYKNTAKMQ